MSHFTVIVFGEEDLDDALEPFNENREVEPYDEEVGSWALEHALKLAKEAGLKGRNPSPERLAKLLNEAWSERYFVVDGKIMESSDSNPNGQWDWWLLGGRWRGFFPLKEGVTYDPYWHLGDPGTSEKIAIRDGKEPHTNYEKDRVADRAYLKDIDFERCEREAEVASGKAFKRWREVFSKHPRPTGWAATRRAGNPNEGGRQAYRDQPAIVAYKKLKDVEYGCPVDAFGFEEEAYVKLCKGAILTPFAMLLNGEWIGKENDSWGTDIADPATHRWNEKVHALYKELPGDTIIAIVDCHS